MRILEQFEIRRLKVHVRSLMPLEILLGAQSGWDTYQRASVLYIVVHGLMIRASLRIRL